MGRLGILTVGVLSLLTMQTSKKLGGRTVFMKLYIYKIDKEYIKTKYPQIRELLSDWRKEKLDKLKMEDARVTSAAAGLLVQYALKDSFGIEKRDLDIKFNEMGKPYFNACFFNITHSGDYAVVLTDDKECGVDIETKSDKNLAITRRILSDSERCYVESFKEEEKQLAFRKVWTMKEAYLKCIGTGISIPLKSFSVMPEECVVRTNEGEDIYLKTFSKEPEKYIIGIASKKDNFKLDIDYIESI